MAVDVGSTPAPPAGRAGVLRRARDAPGRPARERDPWNRLVRHEEPAHGTRGYRAPARALLGGGHGRDRTPPAPHPRRQARRARPLADLTVKRLPALGSRLGKAE